MQAPPEKDVESPPESGKLEAVAGLWLDGLNALARIAFPFVESAVARGLSSRAITSALQSTLGMGLRRETLLYMMREIKGVQDLASRVRYLNPHFVPDSTMIPEALTTLRREYSYNVRVSGTLTGTGQSFTRHITVSTGSLLKPAEAEEIALNLVNSDVESYGMEAAEARAWSLMRAGSGGTFAPPPGV